MQLLLALTPLGLTLASILWMKRGPIISCAIGIAALFILAQTNNHFSYSLTKVIIALQSAFYLGLSVALVVLPGLYLTAVLKEHGIISGIVERFKSLRIDPTAKVLIMILGLLPAAESLTGFGVSMFLSVPILLELYSKEKSQKLALLGMNIMPWGTMGLGTIIGASLIGINSEMLGMATALSSSLVFPMVGFLVLYLIGGWKTFKKWGLLAFIQGILLSTLLYLSSRFISVEVAGVVSGIIVSALLLFFLRGKKSFDDTIVYKHSWYYLLSPYLASFVLLLICRLTPVIWNNLSSVLILHNELVTIAPLTNPGLCLLIVALCFQITHKSNINISQIFHQSMKPILATFAFLLLAQLMREFSVINIIANGVASFGTHIFWLLSPLAGMLSGFVTGSNVGGNVLMIQLQYQIGNLGNNGLIFAAIQNSAAGHSVFASLPMIMLVQALSNDNSETNTQSLLRFTLAVLFFIFLALLGGVVILNYFYH